MLEPNLWTVVISAVALLVVLGFGMRGLLKGYASASERGQANADAAVTAAFWAVLAFAVLQLWGTWDIVVIQPDSFGYLAPAAKATLEGTWDHTAGRPFLYPLFVYAALRAGGSIATVVALQMALYIAGGAILYAALCIPARASGVARELQPTRTLAFGTKLIALTAVALYFGISNEFAASAYYLGPEMPASVLSLLALYFCAHLVAKPEPSGRRTATFAVGASGCAAALIGLKPALAVLSLCVLAVSLRALVRRRTTMSTATLTVAAVSVLALPVSILAVDHVLARKYQDSWATLFGLRTAFCNNADIVASALGTAGSRARKLLGEAGAAETTTFLRSVLGRRNGWPTLGFDGDRCVYDLHREREALEQRHFGGDPDKVADTYRRVLVAAVTADAGAYALRVGRQLREFVFAAPPVDCQPVARWHAWGNGTSHVEQLVLKFAGPQVEQTLPAAPLAVAVCAGAHLLAGPLQATFVVATLLLAGWTSIRRTPEYTFVRNCRRLAALGLLSWLSAAIIVAFVHTFDRYRYVNVALPLFLATLGYTAMYLVAWIRERTAENAAKSAATCARVQPAGRPAARASSSRDQHWHRSSALF